MTEVVIDGLTFEVEWVEGGAPDYRSGWASPNLVAWDTDGAWRAVLEDYDREEDGPEGNVAWLEDHYAERVLARVRHEDQVARDEAADSQRRDLG